ncbi:hypothetical protein LOTGIDRAFT_155023 [Lottia gigantea]|uniref:PLC-beta PH domain-containing protein n=1 Tax=Lottia gigantea TaxID=225164 RepID=V3Z4E0_LOTGI|nr:hypothetical protein LOTGIDRAFT_155023 [Lottia gigantea]ESO85538.1 hypothetical protein LOTGIDRAFT_155023 [Lottia gigantea]
MRNKINEVDRYFYFLPQLPDLKAISELEQRGLGTLESRTVTICSGLDLVNITYTPMIARDADTAKVWVEGLRSITLNIKANNVCPMTQLKKQNLPDSQTNNNNVFRVALNQNQDPVICKVQERLNNDNYPNQPLTINPSTKDYNELYRNYKNMCELFGNPPQFEYVDFALNHPIFCFDLSAHQEDLFKTGVNISIHIKKKTRR